MNLVRYFEWECYDDLSKVTVGGLPSPYGSATCTHTPTSQPQPDCSLRGKEAGHQQILRFVLLSLLLLHDRHSCRGQASSSILSSCFRSSPFFLISLNEHAGVLWLIFLCTILSSTEETLFPVACDSLLLVHPAAGTASLGIHACFLFPHLCAFFFLSVCLNFFIFWLSWVFVAARRIFCCTMQALCCGVRASL